MNKNNYAGTGSFAPFAAIIAMVVFLVIAALLFTALFSYHPTDPAWSHNSGGEIRNALGTLGAWYSDLSFSVLGKMGYLLPIACVVFAIHTWIEHGVDKELLSWRLFMLLTAMLSGCVLWTKHDPVLINQVAQTGGGALGAWLTIGLEKSIKSVPVIMAFSLLIFVISMTLVLNMQWVRLAEWIGQTIVGFFAKLTGRSVSMPKRRKKPKDGMSPSKAQLLNAMATDSAEAAPQPTKRHFSIDRYDADAASNDWAEDNVGSKSNASLADLMKAHQAGSQVAAGEEIVLNNDVHQSAPAQTIPVQPIAPPDEPVTAPETKAEPSFFDLPASEPESSKGEPELPIWQQPPNNVNPISYLSDQLQQAETEPEPPTQPEPTPEPYYQPQIKAVKPDMSAPEGEEDALPFDMTVTSKTEPQAETVPEKPSQPSRSADAMQKQAEKANDDAPLMFSETETVVEEPDNSANQATESVTADTNASAATAAAVPAAIGKVKIGKAYDTNEAAKASPPKPAVTADTAHKLPNIDLLDTPPAQENAYTEDVLASMAEVLEQTLKQFNVNATVMHVSPGPVITRFEIDLAPGIQAKKITALSVDLARALAVSGVRVEEVIPGSSYVGLEVPNKQRQIVYFKDIVRSRAFQQSKSPLTISLGADTSGKPVVADLMKMPHALVAGTTGSGKSVCINVMLLSMLYKATPEDLRLILVDPKMLEMSMYEDIPHLLTPVITDMTDAENALTWAVAEMERRYQLMAALKVRKIDAFNSAVDKANAAGEPIKDPLWQPDESVGYTHHPNLERLPFIVIVIDELADMMMVVGKQVEQLIARLTQKARAAGIHVVLATQRPSTDVLTGLIKANVPTRIAFQVSSGTDSRVIIDGVGAEKLLGYGDMLYVPPGAGHPNRLHGAFVDDAETDRITEFLRSTGEPDYVHGITAKQNPETLGAFGAAEAAETKEDADPLYEEAVQIVLTTGKASISSVQRQLRIGYNRAARMIEDMQSQGIVSEPVNGIRKVLAAPPPKKDI